MDIISGIKQAFTLYKMSKKVNTDVEIPEPYASIIEKMQRVAEKTGYKIYPVGGFVRDLVSGYFPKDLDILVDGPGDNPAVEFASILEQNNVGKNAVTFEKEVSDIDPMAAKFGVAKMIIDGIPVELVMPRGEKYNPDSRKPEVFKADIKQDALRRDFTINTLMYDPATKQVLDPTGHGLEDLKNDVIRSANPDVDTVFKDDPLRMLRAIRFMITKDMKIDPNTLDGIRRNVDRLNIISKERIADELKKIILADKPSRAIRLMKDLGLLKYIIPELEDTEKVMEVSKYHLEEPTFEHIMRTLDNIPPEITSRLAALLHDIGKPLTRTIEKGVVHFINHHNVGADMARKILQRLKFPNEMIEDVSKLIQYHMVPHMYTSEQGDKSLRRFLLDIGHLIDFIYDLAEADRKGSGVRNEEAEARFQEFKERLEKLRHQPITVEQLNKPLIDGNELMEMFNSPPGRWIRDVHKALVDLQLENPQLTKDQAKTFVEEYVRLKHPEIFKNRLLTEH